MNVNCAVRSPEGRPHSGARGVSRGQPAPVREIMQRARPALSSEHLCTTGWAPLFTAGKWAPPGTARACLQCPLSCLLCFLQCPPRKMNGIINALSTWEYCNIYWKFFYTFMKSEITMCSVKIKLYWPSSGCRTKSII